MYIRKKLRVAARTLFVTVLASALIVTGLPYSVTKADTLSSLKDEYAELQQEEQQLQQQLNSLNSQVTTQSKKKATIDKQISATKKQVALLNAQISAQNVELDSKNRDLAATQQSLDSNIKQYKEQICAIYEAGTYSQLEILLTSKSIADFLNKAEVMKIISDHDNQVIDKLKKDTAQLKIDKAALQKALADLQSSQGLLAAKQDMLSVQYAQQSAVVKNLKNNINTAKQQSDAVNQKARETDAAINAEIAKEAEARRRRLEQAAHSGAGGGATVSNSYLVNYAEGFQGVPYVFGSANPNYGFDCSGFVQYVYANAAGIYLPHSAEAQSGYGSPVSQDNLQPGDLVFFDTNGGGSINHVGIYVGGGDFIEANSSYNPAHAVIVTGLFSSSYWASRFRCARHILN